MDEITLTNAQQHYKKMTQTPVAKLVITLGIPTTISMLITNIYNMVDTYFVGTLGESPQGSIGVLLTLQAIIQAFAFMLGHGSGTYVSKELADKNHEQANKYVSTAFFVGGGIGLTFSLLGLIFLTPLMRFLGSTETILPYAKQYGMWVLISCPFLICSLILNNNLRYEGKATYAMIGLVSGGLLNILLDYIFVKVVSLGVFGAGMATAISQIISFTILLVLYTKMAQSKISIKYITKNKLVYIHILKAGFPSFIRQGLNSISGGLLNRLAGHYGSQLGIADQTIDAMSIVNRISNLIMCVGMGIGQGLQPVASFNYEAKHYGRVKKGLVTTVAISFAFVFVLCVPVFFLAENIVYIFQKSQTVVELGTQALHYALIGLMFMPLYVPINMTYQSIRKSGVASFLSLLRSGMVFIPTLIIATSLCGVTGILFSQPLADAITGLINIPFFVHFLREKHNDEIQVATIE